ncbi:hypothetical protein SAY87_028995 [Trapa incisa]|uniref:Uncharacterized protein n=1 Tax=Trapa incisa TaxID=236973 RepID=A0AAN7L3C1_9MYRT|nr:hypothetical protein SAY87_028995 [Trapa incisa]
MDPQLVSLADLQLLKKKLHFLSFHSTRMRRVIRNKQDEVIITYRTQEREIFKFQILYPQHKSHISKRNLAASTNRKHSTPSSPRLNHDQQFNFNLFHESCQIIPEIDYY